VNNPQKAITKTLAIVDSYTTRERFLLLITLIVTVLAFWYTQFYQKKQTQLKILENQIATQQITILTMESLLALNRTNSQQDPNTLAQQKIDDLTVQNSSLDQQLAKAGIFLLNHKKRATIEKTLIEQKGDLELLSIKQLPRELLFKEKKPGKKINKLDKTTHKLYKNQLKIQFVGSYTESWNYLNALEEANLQLNWEKLTYKTTNHPTGLLSITVSSAILQ
jgi:MSHA biogenesis protein MshJ